MFGDDKCSRMCLIFGALFGLLIAVLAYWNVDFNMVISLILGLIAFGIGQWVLKMMFCGEEGEGAMSSAGEDPRPSSSPQPASSAAASAAAVSTPVADAPAASAEAAAKTSSSPSAPAKTEAAGGSWTDSVSSTSGKASDARGATGLKPTAALADEETLRDGVGSWKYGGDADAASAASKPAAATPDLEGDYDGDGVVEGKDEGEKPETLTKARGGKPDDLKQIKGVGPKMEELLNSLGFFHFDQVAGWSDQQVAWVDANLEGFKGRVSRDNWVEQAKILSEGGETEFSKRVEGGNVY